MADDSLWSRVTRPKRQHSLLALFLALSTLVSTAQTQTPTELFDQVWSIVEQRFYQEDLKGLDSKQLIEEAHSVLRNVRDPQRAVEIINSYLDRLQASHTQLFSGAEPEYYELLDVFCRGPQRANILALFSGEEPHYTGILIATKGPLVVDSVPGGPAALAGFLPGDEILSVEDQAFHPINSFRDREGQSLKVQVRREQQTLILTVSPIQIQPRQSFLDSIELSAKVLPGQFYNLGYVRMWSYAGEDFHKELKRVVRERFQSVDGLLLDLRGRWGGAQAQYLEIFGAAPRLTLKPRQGEALDIPGSFWAKPAALLIDASVTSGKEVLAYGFSKRGLGPLVGERTAGAVTAGSLHLLPDRHALYLATAEVLVDGQSLEGIGVSPSHQAETATLLTKSVSILENETLKKEIKWRANLDQSVRQNPHLDFSKPRTAEALVKIDRDNTAWAKSLVQAVGWPGHDLVGEREANLFWLLIQHTSDLEFQGECLELLRVAVKENNASATDLAYLEDRYRMLTGRPQIYGTQLKIENGVTRLWTIENPEQVENRRRAAGLESLQDYLEYWNLHDLPLDQVMIP